MEKVLALSSESTDILVKVIPGLVWAEKSWAKVFQDWMTGVPAQQGQGAPFGDNGVG